MEQELMETQLPTLRMNEILVFVPVYLPVNPALFMHSSLFPFQNSLLVVICNSADTMSFVRPLVFYLLCHFASYEI